MKTQDPDGDRMKNENTRAPFPRTGRFFQRVRAFEVREKWWAVLDYLEAHRVVRRLIYGALVGLIVFVCAWAWGYPWWARRNAISMARQWIAAGKINYAAETVQKALEKDAQEPELWLLASELACLNGQKSMEVAYAHQAVQLQPGKARYVLAWASAALRAEMNDVADQALASVSAEGLGRSSEAQRLLGELARRKRRPDVATGHFEAALKIDGSGAINEVPLGLCLISQSEAAGRQRGLALLEKWSVDPEWGAAALRILLEDAVRRNDRPSMVVRALALHGHPRCTVGDVPNCLGALGVADEEKYIELITQLKRDHLATPESAAQLIGWLNQIGRSAEALAWLKTLPEQNVQRAPLAVSKAEALRRVGDWPALQAWTLIEGWGENVEFLRWAYGLSAARGLGEDARAAELAGKLEQDARGNGAHALFAGTTLFSWGLVQDAESLWWRAAEQKNNLSVEALGTLARFYQVRRDADGQYRVFAQLHAIRPQDDAVANNLAFFAALTGNRESLAEKLALENVERFPGNSTYVATQAFVLLMRGRAAEALKIIKPLAPEAEKSSAVAFVYGLALSGTGEKVTARAVLVRLDPATLTLREVELVKTALGD